MIMNENDVASLVGCTRYTLWLKLFRDEFSHIKQIRISSKPRIYLYKNVKKQDIERLRDLINFKISKNKQKKIKEISE